MEREQRKGIPGWVKVSGIGCAGIVVLLVAAIAGSAYLLRDAMRGFEDADTWIASVEQRLGAPTRYRPEPSPAIPAERIERFLAVRSAVSEARAAAERSLGDLDAEEGETSALGSVTAYTTILPRIAAYQTALQKALLDAGMSHGEYFHLYATGYFAWLQKPPADGPGFEMVNDRGYFFESVEPRPEREVREQRERIARRSLNRILRIVLRNQLEDLRMLDTAEIDRAWEAVLAGELAAMEADALRLPWQDGVPGDVAASLEPYRERLDASYSPLCGMIDLAPAARE